MVGLVALADLHERYAWYPRPTDEIAKLLELDRDGDVIQRFEPPAVVIAIAKTTAEVEKSRGWLSRARHVLVVYDCRAGGEAVEDTRFETYAWQRDYELAAIVSRAMELDERDPVEPAIELADQTLPAGPWMPHDDSRLFAIPQQLERLVFDHQPLLQKQLREVGRDPTSPVRWSGVRMSLGWQFGEHFLDAMLHDWPCGPAKKMWGHSNNYPQQVCMSPARDAFAARFTHDLTFSTHVPIRWQRTWDVHVAAFAKDPQRATFYVRSEYADADDAEEARIQPPGFVIGPALYAVALDREVWKVMVPEECTHVGGPDEGYALFNYEHELMRRGEGKLLGGWYRHATIEHDGQWWREDLAAGERTLLGPIDYRRCIDPSIEAIAADAQAEGRLADASKIRDAHATVSELRDEDDETNGYLPIPGTRNILYVSKTHYRVI